MNNLEYIRKNMETKTTEDLLRIWTENDTDQWSPEAFEAVHQLLKERGEIMPSQKDLFDRKMGDLKNGNIKVRNAGAVALGDIGDPRAIDSLIAAMSDKSGYVRLAAAEALGKIGERRAVDSLIEAARDENDLVRKNAVIALGKIGDDRAFDALAGCLADGMMPISEAAEDAMKMNGWFDQARSAAKNAVANYNYRKLIMMGESEGVLILAIKKYASGFHKRMAFEYLNCGNDRLKWAAELWAARTGHRTFKLKPSPGRRTDDGPLVIWGSHRGKGV
ncbi:MAG TPA: HEAT repeat domain-containing protein [Syntrophorhabdaceae bacterium]|nr:HEAT repeat domain-containing protein [Syntrophorhabdaceae bacterium]